MILRGYQLVCMAIYNLLILEKNFVPELYLKSLTNFEVFFALVLLIHYFFAYERLLVRLNIVVQYPVFAFYCN